jgi:hypothetical protein
VAGSLCFVFNNNRTAKMEIYLPQRLVPVLQWLGHTEQAVLELLF